MKYDVIFCIFGCATEEKYKNEILKINETWGLKAKNFNYKVLFFLGEEKTDLIGEDYIYLKSVENDYSSASHKQNLGLKYIYDNYECNFVYICGTDTYVVLDVLEKHLPDWNHEENICIGGHGDTRLVNDNEIYFQSGGPGYLISFKALSNIHLQLENMHQEWINICSENLNDGCDVCLCYYLKKNNCEFIIKDDLFFHCNYLGYPCHIGYKPNIISCHNMSLLDFDNYTKILDSIRIH
jgi:hypothetical protein